MMDISNFTTMRSLLEGLTKAMNLIKKKQGVSVSLPAGISSFQRF